MSSIFTTETVKELNEPLLKEHVKQRDGTGNQKLNYLPSPHVINEANRIFGFDGWKTEILSLREVDRTNYEKTYNGKSKDMVSIAYMCTLRLTIKGSEDSIHEDTGFGSGVAGNSAFGICSCIELASKEAVTDAVKRCLRYYGNKFGLTLYDKEATQWGVIPIADYEAGKEITAEQLQILRDLYPAREIDDEWVIAMLEGEGWTGKLEELRQDWFEIAVKKTTEYKLEEINAESFVADYDNLKKLVNESVNQNMLKHVFADAYRKCQEQKDKERMLEITELYETKKEELTK